MFEQLEETLGRYGEIAARLAQPGAAQDRDAYARLMKEHKTLTPLVEAYRAWCAAAQDEREARELLESGDAELRALAAETLAEARAERERVETDLRVLLLPHDPNDERSVVMEIRAGAGGEEAALFAADLLRMYGLYAEHRGWKTEATGRSETELGGIREISFLIEGEGAYSRLKFESGVHRVQRVPATESGGRIHTSTVTVAVLPEADEVEVDIAPDDLRIDTYRSSGAGGQHINKTESAIRITHLPTGLVVECQDERSQYKNRDKAMKVLRARLYDRARHTRDARIADLRRSQVGTGDRSERIRTYNFPQSRVTDHRINLTLYRLDAVLAGGLDELIEPLITAEQAEKLKAGEAV